MTYDCKTGKFVIDNKKTLVVKNKMKPFYGSKPKDMTEYYMNEYKKHKDKIYAEHTNVFIWVLVGGDKTTFDYRGMDVFTGKFGDKVNKYQISPENLNLADCAICYTGKNSVYLDEQSASEKLHEEYETTEGGGHEPACRSTYITNLKCEGYRVVKMELPKCKLREYRNEVRSKKKALLDKLKILSECLKRKKTS